MQRCSELARHSLQYVLGWPTKLRYNSHLLQLQMTHGRMTSLMWGKRGVCEVRPLLTNTLYQPHLKRKDVFSNFYFPCTSLAMTSRNQPNCRRVAYDIFFIFWISRRRKTRLSRSSDYPVVLLDLCIPGIQHLGARFARLACVRDDRFAAPLVCTDSDTALWWHVNTCATLTGTARRAMAATQVSVSWKLSFSSPCLSGFWGLWKSRFSYSSWRLNVAELQLQTHVDAVSVAPFLKHKTLVQLEVGTTLLWSPGFTLVSTFDSEAF